MKKHLFILMCIILRAGIMLDPNFVKANTDKTNELNFTIEYHLDENTNLSKAESEVEFGINTKTLSAEEIGLQKEGMVAIGWYAYREFDQSWCYDVNGELEWHKEKPDGATLHLYGNGCSVARTTPAGTTVHFYAQWIKDEFKIKYFQNEQEQETSEEITIVQRGTPTAIKTVEELGFKDGIKKFSGWKIKRESDGCWRVTDGTNIKWAETVEDGWKYDLYARDAIVSKTTSAGEVLDFYATWSDTGATFEVYYHESITAPAETMTSNVEYGVSTKTLTAKELNMEKENNVVKGWTAYREFDQSWCYDVDGKIEWHKEKPENGTLHIYGNGCTISKTAPAGTKVHFYAQWVENSYKIYYYDEVDSEPAQKTTTVNIGIGTEILGASDLGFHKKGEVLLGWTAYQPRDKTWCVTNGQEIKWVSSPETGWNYYLYKNLCKVKKTVDPGEIVEFYAVWISADIDISEEIFERNSEPDYNKIQMALNCAKKSLEPIKVHIPSGKYYINNTLQIFSNTTLELENDTEIVRNDESKCMLISGSATGEFEGGYDQFINVKISGGIWNGNIVNINSLGYGKVKSDLMYFWHGRNLEISNITLENCCGYHHLEIVAMKSVKIDNINCRNFIKYLGDIYQKSEVTSAGDVINLVEAMQIDYAEEENSSAAYPFDGTACQDVSISNCKFENCRSGIGNHHGKMKSSNLKFINNNFDNMSYSCYNIQNMSDVCIENNTANNVTSFLWEVDNSSVAMNKNSINYASIMGCDEMNMIELKNSYLYMKDNIISGAGLDGINISGNTKVDIIENSFKEIEGCVLKVSNAVVNIDGNSFSDCTNYCVYICDGEKQKTTGYVTNNEFCGLGEIVPDYVYTDANSYNTRNSYKIIFDSNGGTGKMGNQTVTYGIAMRLNKNQYQRNGYKFKGWNAYRESDKKWYTTDGWRSGKEIEEKGYRKFLYPNETTVSKSSPVDKDKVTMYAQWEK